MCVCVCVCEGHSKKENEMNKTLWDFEIQTEHSIQARRLELI